MALGLAPTREKAQALILAGVVRFGGRRVEKPGQQLPGDADLVVEGAACPYVSRGGVKLAGALDAFGLSPEGRRCLDAGASTGGFTDCLLQRGAREVVAADVGTGQLDWTLRRDPRVVVLEGVNVRGLLPSDVGEAPSLVVADLSFISLRLVLPALVACAPQADFVVLVKPQFEAGRERVGRGGVVRDPAVWLDCLRAVADCLEGLGLTLTAAALSVLPGPAGNREFFLHARRGAPALPTGALDAVVHAADAAARGG